MLSPALLLVSGLQQVLPQLKWRGITTSHRLCLRLPSSPRLLHICGILTMARERQWDDENDVQAKRAESASNSRE